MSVVSASAPVLINKIMTSCPNVSTVYLLVRKKKGKDVQTRVDEIFDGTVSGKIQRKVLIYGNTP